MNRRKFISTGTLAVGAIALGSKYGFAARPVSGLNTDAYLNDGYHPYPQIVKDYIFIVESIKQDLIDKGYFLNKIYFAVTFKNASDKEVFDPYIKLVQSYFPSYIFYNMVARLKEKEYIDDSIEILVNFDEGKTRKFIFYPSKQSHEIDIA